MYGHAHACVHICTWSSEISIRYHFHRGLRLLLTLDLSNFSRLIVIKPQGSFCLSLASSGDYEYAQEPSIYKLNYSCLGSKPLPNRAISPATETHVSLSMPLTTGKKKVLVVFSWSSPNLLDPWLPEDTG